jgi:hypothetical protein
VWCIVEEAEELITGRLADMIEPEAQENVALEKGIATRGPYWANCHG